MYFEDPLDEDAEALADEDAEAPAEGDPEALPPVGVVADFPAHAASASMAAEAPAPVRKRRRARGVRTSWTGSAPEAPRSLSSVDRSRAEAAMTGRAARWASSISLVRRDSSPSLIGSSQLPLLLLISRPLH